MKKWILISVGVFAVMLLGALAAITVPNILKYRYKSKQAEAKYMLKVLLTKEQERKTTEGTWATSPHQLQEYVASSPRSSTCFLGEKGWGGRTSIAFTQLPAEVQAQLQANAPQGDDFTIACAVNLDEDADLDVWVISVKAPEPKIVFSDMGE